MSSKKSTKKVSMSNEDIEAIIGMDNDECPTKSKFEVHVEKILAKKKKRSLKKQPEPVSDSESDVDVNDVISGAVDALSDKVDKEEFEWIFKGHVGLAKIFVEHQSKFIRIISKDGGGYMFNQMTQLWQMRDVSHFPRFVADFLDIHLTDVIQKQRDSGQKDMDKYKALLKVQTQICNIQFCESIFKAAKPHLIDWEFMGKLNGQAHLLPIRGCKVIDLRTLEVRYRTVDDMFDFEIDAGIKTGATPNADKFFREVMNNDAEVLEYVQTNLGYCMTGNMEQRCFYIFWGIGSNGKSCLLEFLQRSLGKLAVVADKKVFIKSDGGSSHSEHMMPMVGARCAVLSETEEGESLNAKTIKSVTGNDKITCRPIYGKQFEFKPTAKCIILTNHKPVLDVHDTALVDRPRFVPYLARFTPNPKGTELRKDDKFIEELRNNHFDEVFTWFCRGAAKYYTFVAKNEPIPIPKSLTEAKNAYMAELDSVAKFMDECCKVVDKKRIKRGDLFAAYQAWCTANNERTVKDSVFYARVGKDFEPKKSSGVHYFCGIKLEAPEEPEFD
jgi:P4 family phage/plasmid primase-like protien